MSETRWDGTAADLLRVAEELKPKEPIVAGVVTHPRDWAALKWYLTHDRKRKYAKREEPEPSEVPPVTVLGGITIRTNDLMPEGLAAYLDAKGNLIRVVKLEGH